MWQLNATKFNRLSDSMTISFEKALGTYETALKLRADKASVLSSNLANADTPNYKARDFNFHEALKSQTENSNPQVNLKMTHGAHINFSNSGRGLAERMYRIPNQPAIDGNTVEEQVEHAEFMKNNLEFQTAFTMLNGRFKGLTKAITGESR